MRLSRLTWLLGGLVCGGVACAGDGTVEPGNGNGGGSGFAATVQPIFTGSCAVSGCHAGNSPAQGMNLSSGQAIANIVNVQSTESSLLRVAPGLPDSSYLVHKIQGTQASVGGTGGRMPLGRSPLSASQIDAIRAWISDGAPNN